MATTSKITKTGFDYLDNLSSDSERAEAFKNIREHWNSLTQEERVKALDTYYTLIREKMREKGGLITEQDAAREILNIDLPRAQQEAIEEAEKNGRYDLANELKRRRIGVDTFAIVLIDEETGEPISPD